VPRALVVLLGAAAAVVVLAGQLQLDIYGEALDSVFMADAAGFGIPHRGRTAVRAILDWLGEHWDQPRKAFGKPGAAAGTSPTAG
jgi:hypothetical protein